MQNLNKLVNQSAIYHVNSLLQKALHLKREPKIIYKYVGQDMTFNMPAYHYQFLKRNKDLLKQRSDMEYAPGGQ